MRVSWVSVAGLVVLAAALVTALPVEEPQSSEDGWRTFQAFKDMVSPLTNYFRSIPSKTPSDIAADVREKVTDVKEWARESEAIQALHRAITPVKEWVQDKATDLKDQTFRDMYEDVSVKVKDLDQTIGTWLENVNSK